MSDCPHGMVMNSDANQKYGLPWCLHCNAELEKDANGKWHVLPLSPKAWK